MNETFETSLLQREMAMLDMNDHVREQKQKLCRLKDDLANVDGELFECELKTKDLNVKKKAIEKDIAKMQAAFEHDTSHFRANH